MASSYVAKFSSCSFGKGPPLATYFSVPFKVPIFQSTLGKKIVGSRRGGKMMVIASLINSKKRAPWRPASITNNSFRSYRGFSMLNKRRERHDGQSKRCLGAHRMCDTIQVSVM
jgi:hypothetical protein